MNFTNIRLPILFGSETGNAEEVAQRIWRESKRFFYQSSLKSLEEYDVLNLCEESIVICVCSTTGQGDVPENMKKFWQFLLRKNIPHNSLKNLKFAVLGLGDSSYAKFNFAAKKLFKRFEQLGGEPIIPLGLGDDQHDLGYESAVTPWVNSLWEKLLILYPVPSTVTFLNKVPDITPRWKVSVLKNQKKILHTTLYSTLQNQSFYADMLKNERVTAVDPFQDVRLIKLNCSNEYEPGDTIALRPQNLDWKVEEFLQVLHANNAKIVPNSILKLHEIDPEFKIPSVLTNEFTFDQLCQEYFDLMSIPKRSTFEILATLTDCDLEKEKCLELSTSEGLEEYYNYCHRPKRNIVEVLHDFPNATKNLTVDILFELFPPLKPREFSIASSYRFHNEIHILLAVVKYRTKLLKERYGLCSNYLADLKAGSKLTAWIRKGKLKFPKDLNVPVIMIGPGTGVAPFRNYIYECVAKNIADYSKLILFFGCRNARKDFHCKDDFTGLNGSGKIKLICAFSRDQDKKVYVQDKIRENGCLVWDALRQKCFIFVAGNAKNMPEDVRKSILKVCVDFGGMNEKDAEVFVKTMEKENRYQTECWS